MKKLIPFMLCAFLIFALASFALATPASDAAKCTACHTQTEIAFEGLGVADLATRKEVIMLSQGTLTVTGQQNLMMSREIVKGEILGAATGEYLGDAMLASAFDGISDGKSTKAAAAQIAFKGDKGARIEDTALAFTLDEPIPYPALAALLGETGAGGSGGLIPATALIHGQGGWAYYAMELASYPTLVLSKMQREVVFA